LERRIEEKKNEIEEKIFVDFNISSISGSSNYFSGDAK